MKASTKYACLYALVLLTLILTVTQLAQAQESVPPPEGQFDVEAVEEEQGSSARPAETLDQAELDQMLAPIALYPDTLLSHILVAATYPLEVVQAARWREANQDLSADAAREAVQEKEWDPSVKALVPFADLLETMSDDLDWLQRLGDAFLLNEDQLLSSVQALRRRAYERGTLADNEYIEVVEEEEDIIIQPVEREVVYVPYYDTRVVYGHWWWRNRAPIFWHHPHHYYSHAGFYWAPRTFVSSHFYFGGFHWRRRYTVINHHVFHHGIRFNDGIRRVRVREYPRWQHNPGHRRGVRYHHAVSRNLSQYNKVRPVSTFKGQTKARHVQVRTKQPASHRVRNNVAVSTREKLQRQPRQADTSRQIARAQKPQKQAKQIRQQASSRALRSSDYRKQPSSVSREQRAARQPQGQTSTRRSQERTKQYKAQTKPRQSKSYSAQRNTPRAAPQRQRRTQSSRSMQSSSAPRRNTQKAVKRH